MRCARGGGLGIGSRDSCVLNLADYSRAAGIPVGDRGTRVYRVSSLSAGLPVSLFILAYAQRCRRDVSWQVSVDTFPRARVDGRYGRGY